ncbi:ARM repeat-containing protein [Calocera cornea HHB12733]|uniref:ARM repeat-containing protein n=1 Tax=Calocera cornea HHB12733 TaxID=1353952 RepID=A0A165FCM1_9BASI|nr:ARM repeat-containing protein [Calocera cornea HHB12733]
MFLDSDNLTTLEKIFLFARSDAAYHRLFVARTLPEWLPSVDPHEAVEYILPLLNGLGTDPEDTVRETFAPALAKVMWYFFTTCALTEEEQPLTPSAHSDDSAYGQGPPTIPVSSFTPLLGSLLLSVNRGVGESARWGVVQVLQRLKEEEEAETALPPREPPSRRRAKELERERAKKWQGWIGGPLDRDKRDMIRRELILGVVLGMARLEEDEEDAAGEGGYDEDEMDELGSAAIRERASQRGDYDYDDDDESPGVGQENGSSEEEEAEGEDTPPGVYDVPEGRWAEEEQQPPEQPEALPPVSEGGEMRGLSVLREPILADAPVPPERAVNEPAVVSERPLDESAVVPRAASAEQVEGALLDQPPAYTQHRAEGTTTFLLPPMSPRSIGVFSLRDVATREAVCLPEPRDFALEGTGDARQSQSSDPPTAITMPKTSPSPPQLSDESTPAMSIDASPSDSSTSPSGRLDDAPPDEDGAGAGEKPFDPQPIVELVAQASELGMAMLSPEEAEAVSPLHRSDDDTPTSPALTPSDSEGTVRKDVSPNPPSSEDGDMDLAQEEEESDEAYAAEEAAKLPSAAIVISPPLENALPPEYFPSPPVNFPPPQQPVTPSVSPPDWLPVPPSPDVTGPHPQDSSSKTSPLALIASLALMSAIASSAALRPPDLEVHFLPELLRIASQADEWVRREAGFVIGALAKAVSTPVVRSQLVPLLIQFSNDAFWHVRHSSLFSAPPVLTRLDPDERRQLALEMFLSAARDPSRAVRAACLELLGEAIATFKDDEGGPPEELVQLFLGDENDRPEDTESDIESPLEWFSTPGLGLKPVPTTKRDADRCLVCAFNFPAVALTLGKDRWPQLRDYYLYLARDKSLKVRRTLASSLGAIAEIIGPEATRRDLIHVWKRAFETTADGYVDEDVVGWAIESIPGLLKSVGGEFPREIVQRLRIWWTGMMHKRWRLREQVAIKLPVLAQGWAHVEGVAEGIRDLLGLALTDDVAAVRESAAEGVSGICAALRGGPAEEALRQELLDLSEHESFRYRMTFVASIQSLLADEMKDDLQPLWPRVWALGADPVVDVRISVARLVATAVGMDTFFREPTSRPHLLNNLIRRLTQDKSYQVRSFVGFLRSTHNVTPVTTPVRGASLMSPSAKFSRPPLVLSPSGSQHDEPENYTDDHVPGMDDTREFYSAIARGRDAPLPVFTLPPSPRHPRKMEAPPVSLEPKPAEKEPVSEIPANWQPPTNDALAYQEPPNVGLPEENPEDDDDLTDPFADSTSLSQEEDQDSLDSDGEVDM